MSMTGQLEIDDVPPDAPDSTETLAADNPEMTRRFFEAFLKGNEQRYEVGHLFYTHNHKFGLVIRVDCIDRELYFPGTVKRVIYCEWGGHQLVGYGGFYPAGQLEKDFEKFLAEQAPKH